jgi:hypothetical protein
MLPLHPGQVTAAAALSTSRDRPAPQREQNPAPSNIRAKHEGQLSVASLARQ